MRFDDRLMTVLNQPAGSRHDQAVRWRQLVDLVARAGSEESDVLTRALAEISAGVAHVDERLRAAAARAIAALPLPFALIEIFVRDSLSVSAPVLAAATLDARDWDRLIASANDETRQFIEAVRPVAVAAESERAEDEVSEEPEPAQPNIPNQSSEPAAPGGRSLAEVVARIERRRRLREGKVFGPQSAPAETSLALFRWECGPSGDIRWVEGAPRGALIGLSLAGAKGSRGEGSSIDMTRAFALRAPFRDALFTVAGDGVVAGEWKVSGVPAFEPSDGRFAGYRGIAMRERTSHDRLVAAGELHQIMADPASLRELVHEIKTPLNAIIGFAEIIDGQYLGPADRLYRERAAQIVGQARLLLGAIDDLDFAAKSRAEAGGDGAKAPLGTLVSDLFPELRVRARELGGELKMVRSAADSDVAVASGLAQRILGNFLGAVIESVSAGDSIGLSVERAADRCRVVITRPTALRGLGNDTLFGSGGEANPVSAQFSLRLARGLARLAGVPVVASERDLALVFPRA